MKNATSRMLHAHWDSLRGARAAPERGEIEPGEIRHILADSFILEIEAPTRTARIRLAGTRLCALFGRELKGAAFVELWGEGPANDPWSLVETVIEDTTGVVAGLRGETGEDPPLDLELVILPLRHRGKPQVRAIGALSAVGVPSWLGLRPLTALSTVSLRVLVGGASVEPPARRHALVLHQGGLA